MKSYVAIVAGIVAGVIYGVAVTAAQAPVAQTDRSRVDAGKRLFADTCQNDHCHGGSARNMEDYSGFTAEHLRRVINEGIPDAGMQAFKDVFTPEQVEQLVAYILSVSKDPAASAARGSSWLALARAKRTHAGLTSDTANCRRRAFAATDARRVSGAAR